MSKTTELGENTIIGNPLVTDNCVKFKANSRGNILFCEDGTDLRGSTITFNGDNALVYLSKNKHQYKLSVSMNRDNTYTTVKRTRESIRVKISSSAITYGSVKDP